MDNPGKTKLTAPPAAPVVLRYGLAIALVAIALGTTFIHRYFNSPPRFISHFTLARHSQLGKPDSNLFKLHREFKENSRTSDRRSPVVSSDRPKV
jgi:hypothetical protein